MNILNEIIGSKRTEVAKRKRLRPASTFGDSPWFNRRSASLHDALNRQGRFPVIAEVKRGSPSAGLFRPDASAARTAEGYAAGGAAAISVLTDERYFHGSLGDLTDVRAAVTLPVLRKDFIIDPYQIGEAKAAGADAVLLIADAAGAVLLRELQAAADEAGLETLVELYESKEIDTIETSRMKVIGINNRDLRSFSVDIRHSIELAALLPDGVLIVSESGISTADHLRELRKHGIDAALIGEHFMRSENPGKSLARLLKDYETPGAG